MMCDDDKYAFALLAELNKHYEGMSEHVRNNPD
jgi:hypothetical protein